MKDIQIIKYCGLLILISLLGLAKSHLIIRVIGICVGISLLVALTVFDWNNRDNSTNYTRAEYFLSMALINAILYWYITHEIFIMWALSCTGLGLSAVIVYIGERISND
jgi:hypothetical protein